MDDSLSPAPVFPVDEVCGTSSRFVEDAVSQACGLSINDIDEHALIFGDQGEELNEGNQVEDVDDGNGEESVAKKPFVGQVFDTFDGAYVYYNTYALSKGFGVRKSSTNKSTKTNQVIFRKYVCDKEGKKDPNDKRQASREVIPRRTARLDCQAKMAINLKDKKWIVSVIEDEHSHELTSPLRRRMHRSHNRLYKKESVKNLMDSYHGIGLQPAGIAKVINVQSDGADGVLSPQQVQSHLRLKKKNNMGLDAGIVAERLQRKRAEEQDFFFSIELDSECTLRSMFWADSMARESYMTFSDVIVFDVTYRTNMYLMPFAPFTRVNHHRQSILFGCALLADETEETFTWLFKQWLQCMHGKVPGTIITDMDVAMRNAIKNVFPNTRHRFCSWHITKHLVEHVPAMREADGDFPKDYYRWYNTGDIDECEMEWRRLCLKYKIDENDWLSKMWELRIHWVPAYWKGTFTAGMTSSQRSESMNAFFDGFVNQKTSLRDFVANMRKRLLTVVGKKHKRISSQKIQRRQ
ncbi:protein FAR1-RELATED SEQUENCE 5-like [Tasmannia lanceolata]|uniref:protein FAR1-RELATED SEQUENCE 5-like n=1 Tax=Tasmannia lanceolata TaxID=3420 RepID=UPI0040633658